MSLKSRIYILGYYTHPMTGKDLRCKPPYRIQWMSLQTKNNFSNFSHPRNHSTSPKSLGLLSIIRGLCKTCDFVIQDLSAEALAQVGLIRNLRIVLMSKIRRS